MADAALPLAWKGKTTGNGVFFLSIGPNSIGGVAERAGIDDVANDLSSWHIV